MIQDIDVLDFFVTPVIQLDCTENSCEKTTQ